MSNSTSEMYDFDAWFVGFLDGEGCIRVGIADRERYTTGFELAPVIRIAHEQVSGTIDAEGWIGVEVTSSSTYRVEHRLTPRVEVGQSSNDRLMDALCAYCETRNLNCHVTSIEHDDNRADQYVWGIQGISHIRRLLTPLRGQFIVKREQVDLLLDEILPRMDQGVHHDRSGFLEVMSYVDQFNSYKGGNRGKYTLEYFENLWDMEYTGD